MIRIHIFTNGKHSVQGRPISTIVFLSLCFIVPFVLSTRPALWGWYAQWCLRLYPRFWLALLIISFTKWVPLSDRITFGIPYVGKKWPTRHYATDIASFFLQGYTSHFEKASIITKTYLAPCTSDNSIKSMCIMWNGCGGSGNAPRLVRICPCTLFFIQVIHVCTCIFAEVSKFIAYQYLSTSVIIPPVETWVNPWLTNAAVLWSAFGSTGLPSFIQMSFCKTAPLLFHAICSLFDADACVSFRMSLSICSSSSAHTFTCVSILAALFAASIAIAFPRAV